MRRTASSVKSYQMRSQTYAVIGHERICPEHLGVLVHVLGHLTDAMCQQTQFVVYFHRLAHHQVHVFLAAVSVHGIRPLGAATHEVLGLCLPVLHHVTRRVRQVGDATRVRKQDGSHATLVLASAKLVLFVRVTQHCKSRDKH